MARHTEISWCSSTFNPIWGCTKISPACDHCYAATLAKRWGHDRWGAGKPRLRTSETNWRTPLEWDRLAGESREPWRVFVGSMCDVFDNEWPEGVRDDLWALVRATRNLTWMPLTKRIGNASWALRGAPVERLWMGITVANQQEYERDWPKLERIPSAVRWLSCEPLLGPIDLGAGRPDWVVAGGESGGGARPADPAWFRALRDQCADLGIPFHFKQWGSHAPVTHPGNVIRMVRMSKRKAGHLLDGREHRAFPIPRLLEAA